MRWLRPLHPLLRRGYAWHNARPRRFQRDGLDLLVLPGVFHPGFFHSSGTLARHVATLDLKGRAFLELGAGTGRVALTAARAGAIVTASDINPAAVENLRMNSERNGLPVTVLQSDLFDGLPGCFDIIAINPPYYPEDPQDLPGRAFFSGTDHAYFVKLFGQLAPRIADGSEVLMVLSAQLCMDPIMALADAHGLYLSGVHAEWHWGEEQVVNKVLRR
jgi:release factor glutamine methyltransferase